MLIFMVIFSLLGMELFAKPMDDPLWDGSPYRFDNTLHGMVTIFVVLSGENWNEVLYSGTGRSAAARGGAVLHRRVHDLQLRVTQPLHRHPVSNITSLPMEEESERRQSVGQAQFVHRFVYGVPSCGAARPPAGRDAAAVALDATQVGGGRVRHQNIGQNGGVRSPIVGGKAPPKPRRRSFRARRRLRFRQRCRRRRRDGDHFCDRAQLRSHPVNGGAR